MQKDPGLQRERAVRQAQRANSENSESSTPNRTIAVVAVALLVVALATAAVIAGGDDAGLDEASTASDQGAVAVPMQPVRLLDTRSATGTGQTDASGEPAGESSGEDATLEVDVSDSGIVDDAGNVVLDVTAIAGADAGAVTVFDCGDNRPDAPSLTHQPDERVSTQVIVGVDNDGTVCVTADSAADVVLDLVAAFPEAAFDPITPARRLLDTRPDGSTFDDEFAGTGTLEADAVLELPVAERVDVAVDDGPLLVTLDATGESPGSVTLYPCGGLRPATSNVNLIAGATVSNSALVPMGADGSICLHSDVATELNVDLNGIFDADVVRPLDAAERLVDTRADADSVDGEFAGIGLRPAQSTLQVAVAGRGTIPAGATAIVANLTAVDSDTGGAVALHAPMPETPDVSILRHDGEGPISEMVIVPVGPDGNVCLHTDAATHLVLDVMAWVAGQPTTPTPTAQTAVTAAPASAPGSPAAPPGAATSTPGTAAATAGTAAATPTSSSEGGCPAQELFPHWQMVAIYGTQRSATLGVLGEQDPEQAAERLDEVVEPWLASDRPILPAFELITVLATSAEGDEGNYNAPASEEFVQEYLDAARRHGIYLILDMQTGRSDFLTEAKRYEKFLREPDVGLALDPEWRTPPPDRPKGGFVGHVDASEVNQVADWLAEIVAEEDLPEKLLVVHQFEDQMIRNKDQLREPPGIALNIHMDGLGTRQQKQGTYSRVRVDPPWNNGLKLFYDEDVDIYTASEVLGGAFDPMPDLVTYQ